MNTLKKLGITYCILLTLFTVMIIGVHLIPKNVIKENVIESTHTLQSEGLYRKFFNFKLFQMDNFTDTYMLNLAISGDESKPVESAMMNYNHTSKNFFDLAYDTENVANDNFQNLNKKSYGRYWQGYLVTLRPLLTIMDYVQIRILNYMLLSILLIACIYLIYKKIDTSTAFIFGISLMLIFFPIVPLSMQFSTCFYWAFIGVICILQFPILTKNNSNIACTFFSLGAITVYFDFLTTPQLTFGLPLIAYLLAYNPKNKWKSIIQTGIYWCMGYGILWGSKWAMGYLLTNNNILADAMQSVELRSSNLYKGMEMTIPNIFNFIWMNVQMRNLEFLVYTAIGCLIALLLVYFYFIKSKKTVMEYSYLLFIAMIVPAWFLVLRNHSIQHGWFTWRAALLTVFSLFLFIYHTTDISKLSRKNKNVKS